MLRSMNGILGYKVAAGDDEFGKVEDLYFDDWAWTIRYLVMDTGRWLSGRRVLLAPEALGEPDWDRSVLPVCLTRDQIEGGPPVSAVAPVSREAETLLAKYYGWVMYWEPNLVPEQLRDTYAADSDLRSIDEVRGYKVVALDSEVGNVADFIADTDDWSIRYIVVNIGHWLPGLSDKQVLVSPAWIAGVSWPDRQVRLDLSREQVSESPRYDPQEPVNREIETRLYDYYGRPEYW